MWGVGEEGSEIVTDACRHKGIYGCLLTAKRCGFCVVVVCMYGFVVFVCFVLGGVCLFVFYINLYWCNLLTHDVSMIIVKSV